MSKVIVIGDIHNHWAKAEQIASKYDATHTVIFVGDYFDDFGDTAQDAIQTARWLKESLDKPNRIHLMGNHDINYSYLNYTIDSSGHLQNIYNCSGYNMVKDDAINRIMTEGDWNKIKFYHIENGFWFTHAGLHPYWFECPVRGMDENYVKEKLDKATDDYYNRTRSDLLGAAGRCRGGTHRAGGILWCDDQKESLVIRNFKQIFGHTPSLGRCSVDEERDGTNINVDCGLSEVVEIDEDGTFKILNTGLKNFYLDASC